MKILKKKFARRSAVIVALGAVFALLIGTAPANAFVDYRPSHHADSVEFVTIGNAFDVDYSCSNGATNDGVTYGIAGGDIPPGLSYDPVDAHIKGTPTLLGIYALPYVLCGHDGFDEGFSIGTIVIQAPATPAPSVTATALNNANCEVRIVGTFPATPDPGTATVTIGNPGGGVSLSLANQVGSTLLDLTFSAFDLSAISDPDITAVIPQGGDYNQCGSDLSVILSYQYQGAESAQDSTTVKATTVAAVQPPSVCAEGSFSVTGNTPCTSAPRGSFVPSVGATSVTSCPAGQTTFLLGARSHFECFKVVTQTVKAIMPPTKGKFGVKVLTPKTTDLGAALALTATGPCSVKSVRATVIVKGKKTSVNRYQITLGKTAGSCVLTYTNAGDDSHTALTSVKRIKVSK